MCITLFQRTKTYTSSSFEFSSLIFSKRATAFWQLSTSSSIIHGILIVASPLKCEKSVQRKIKINLTSTITNCKLRVSVPSNFDSFTCAASLFTILLLFSRRVDISCMTTVFSATALGVAERCLVLHSFLISSHTSRISSHIFSKISSILCWSLGIIVSSTGIWLAGSLSNDKSVRLWKLTRRSTGEAERALNLRSYLQEPLLNCFVLKLKN